MTTPKGFLNTMLLSSAIAKALLAIIMISTQGTDALKLELPLQVEDRGDTWLVKGTPHRDERLHINYATTYLFLRKDSAEVTGIGTAGRFITTPKQKSYLRQLMTDDQYKRMSEPPTQFEPNGIHELYFAAYGGLINKPVHAVDYAYELMQTKPELAAIPKADLRAEEVDTAKDKIWHVSRRRPDGTDVEVLSFSRKTGKLLSGDL